MSTRPALTVLRSITTAHWAMTPEAIQLLCRIALRENESPESLARQLGRPLENTRATTVRDGVATIPVVGPMFRYADFFTEISGAVTYEELAQDVQAALINPQVRAILLSIDSPGGEVTGIAQLAEQVAAARGKKPIIAFAGDMAASAGYWLASAADEVVASPTGILGSIGVRMAMVDTSKRDEARGVTTIEVVSSQSPKKAVDPTTDDGRAQVQATIDALAQVFIDAVAGYRGVTPETVAAEFGQGDVFVGAAAVDAGLADRVMTYESLHAELSQRAAQPATSRSFLPSRRAGAMSPEHPTPGAVMPDSKNTTPAAAAAPERLTAAQIEEQYPEAVAAWRTEARAAALIEGATAERERLSAIDKIAQPGHEALVAAAKADGTATADSLARQILEAEAATRQQRMSARQRDEAALTPPAPMAPEHADPTSAQATVTRVLTFAPRRPSRAALSTSGRSDA